jgi:tRNA(adenine34) deaminase
MTRCVDIAWQEMPARTPAKTKWKQKHHRGFEICVSGVPFAGPAPTQSRSTLLEDSQSGLICRKIVRHPDDMILETIMKLPSIELDRKMMTQCIALSSASGKAGEYPYGAIISRGDEIVAASINRVTQDGDVTRHAEVVTISAAQKTLDTVSLDECTIYVNAEPCVFCCYAIRESRIARVVYGLQSPHMGGVSKWNVLADEGLSCAMPEVFAPPPEIVAGFMAKEAEQALVDWNPLVAKIIRERGLFGVAPRVASSPTELHPPRRRGFLSRMLSRMMRFLRREFFDRFGRR